MIWIVHREISFGHTDSIHEIQYSRMIIIFSIVEFLISHYFHVFVDIFLSTPYPAKKMQSRAAQ